MADNDKTGSDPNLIMLTDTAPTRADAVKNRAVLLRTARQLFNAQGVDNVSMTQLADDAGVGKGTLYRHFSNKAELCYALLDTEQRDLQAETFKYLRDKADPVNTLRAFLMSVVEFVWRNDELLSPALHDGNVSSLDFPAHVWYRQTIRGLLGRTDAPGDLDYMTDVLYIMLNVETIHYQRHTLGYDRTRIINGLLAVVDRLVG